MREICKSGSEGGGGVSCSLPLSEDHDPSVRDDADTSPAKLGRI